MEYVQERVTTLHDLGGETAANAPVERTAVVVPVADRGYASRTAERTLATLDRIDAAEVIVPLRTTAEGARGFCDRFGAFERVTPIWCNGPRTDELLAERGLTREEGAKGRDVWLGLGVAADGAPYVAVHDADSPSYGAETVPRLCWPLANGYEFAKGYYARVEDGRLYGRLCRLFYEPLVHALCEAYDAPILDYLGAFRYALAGEIGLTADLARRIRVPPSWGLEIGTLGETFDIAGFAGTAQVDLGRHEHDHRPVGGPAGLAAMSERVARALFRALAEENIDPDVATLAERYRTVADRYVRGYAADAAFNGLAYAAAAERDQVDAYAESIRPFEFDDDPRLPAWRDADLDPGEVREATRADLDDLG